MLSGKRRKSAWGWVEGGFTEPRADRPFAESNFRFRCYRTPKIIEAQAAFKRGEIPADAYAAFKAQVHNAYQRDIPFLFTIHEWWSWWKAGGRWHRRGIGTDKLVMARKGDRGPYSPTNVYCCTHSQNCRDVDAQKLSRQVKASWRRRAAQPGFRWHLAQRGAGHPRSQAVIGPLGRFESAALAADAAGVWPSTIQRKARSQIDGWRCEDAAGPSAADPEFKLAAD